MQPGTTVMPRSKRNDTAVKVDAEIVRKAKHVALNQDISLAEYLSRLLRAPVDRDYEQFKKKLDKD